MTESQDRFEKTLKILEELNSTWEYKLSEHEDKQHAYGRTVALWFIPRHTGDFLRFMVEILDAKQILELGCSAGYSTLFLAKAAQRTKGHVFTTEILPVKISLAKKYFRMAGLSRFITLFEREIADVLKDWPTVNNLDFVFMDADKKKLFPIFRVDFAFT